MNRALLVAVAVGAAGGLPGLNAQVRGAELYRLMAREPLVRTTGTTRLQWLAVGGGYLETVGDSAGGGRTFFRMDPATAGRAPVFDAATVARITAEYNRLSGRSAAGVPFAQFAYEWDGRAISFTAGGERYLYDLRQGELRKLVQPKAAGPLDPSTGSPGSFSPDFNFFVFTKDYDNLFLLDTRTGQEERLTTGTSEDNLVGFLGAGQRFAWSPDSRRIAYLKADQKSITPYPILRSLEHPARVELFRYPFTTDANPAIELWVADLDTKQHTKIASGTVDQPYIRDIGWLPGGTEMRFQVVNQWASRVELKAADPRTGQVRTILVEEDSAYLNPPHNFRVLKDGKRFLWSSERTGWKHLYLYDLQGSLIKQLTSGDWEMADIVQVDEGTGWVYFNGHTNFGLDRHLFRVKLDGSGLTKVTTGDGLHTVSMDPGARFFTDDFSSLTAPRTVTLRSADGRLVRELATTNVDRVTQLGLLPPELLTVKGGDGTTDVSGILFKPADFDPTKRYPLVIEVYGGPHSKQVRNSYETAGFRARMAQLGFLVAEFDARGTPYRGKRFQAGNYLRLGQEDVDDQAAAVRQLASRPYVDRSRVGVTGLSHGGYMTLMMMLRYPDVFQVGVAGAALVTPSTGPRQYVGRFMRTPEANPDGYAKADAMAYAANLKGQLLIYQGTNDRNVVLGNTMQFVKKLVDLGKPVDMMIYPDGVHVLTGKDAIHNTNTTIAYFLRHLRPEGWERSLVAVWGS